MVPEMSKYSSSLSPAIFLQVSPHLTLFQEILEVSSVKVLNLEEHHECPGYMELRMGRRAYHQWSALHMHVSIFQATIGESFILYHKSIQCTYMNFSLAGSVHP